MSDWRWVDRLRIRRLAQCVAARQRLAQCAGAVCIAAACIVSYILARGKTATFAAHVEVTPVPADVQHVARRVFPLRIEPTGGFRGIIRHEELGPIVASVAPSWAGPDVGLMLHALRTWGSGARIDAVWEAPGQPGLVTYPPAGQLEILLRDPIFRRAFKSNPVVPPLLTIGRVGVAVTTNGNPEISSYRGQYHIDKLLQVLAEIGCPADTPVEPYGALRSGGRYTVSNILDESLWCHSEHHELEFTINAYSRWLKAPGIWRNRFGQRYSLEDLANRLLERQLGTGSCLGSHLPYSLASLLRANESELLLSQATATLLSQRPREVSQMLQDRQQSNGAWNEHWAGKFVRTPSNWVHFLDVEPYAEILVTGHHLEWIAISPPELCPPREAVEKAARFLIRAVGRVGQAFFLDPDTYPLGTHATRALCSIECVEPSAILKRYHHVPSGTRPLAGDKDAL